MAYLVKINVSFNLRDASSPVPTPVVAVVRWGGLVLKYPTGEHALPEHWHRKMHRVDLMSVPAVDQDAARATNAALDAVEARVKDKFEAWRKEHGRPPVKVELQALLHERIEVNTDTPTDLWGHIETLITEAPKRKRLDGRPMHKGLSEQYARAREVLKDFERETGYPVTFEAVNTTMYSDLVTFLEGRGLYSNTIGKYIRTFKRFLNTAVSKGRRLPGYNPSEWVVLKEDATDIALTMKELDAIEDLDLSDRPALANARDILLLGCWCPVRYGDLRTLRPSKIGKELIRFHQEKTGDEVEIARLPGFDRVLQRRNGELPEFISEQRLNNHLKEIARMVPELHELVNVKRTGPNGREETDVPRWKMVSTHTMRRTGATNMYVLGVPALSIMAATGHRTEKTFLGYVKLNKAQHAEIARKQVMRALEGLKGEV